MRTAFATLLLSFAAVPAQQRISLDGTWQVRDEAAQDWRAVHVPGAFEAVLGDDFDGRARYRRTLPLPERRTPRTFVEFDAVATYAEVFVNGHRVQDHLGGWTPFRAELTRHLKWDGSDTLEVLVDERVGHNTQGFLPIIQPHFGGIWQSVTLCCGDRPQLDRHDLFCYARLLDDGNGELTVRASIVPGDRNRRGDALHVQLRDGDRVVLDERRGFGGFAEPWHVPQVRRWRPGAPELYTLRVALLERGKEVDVVERRVGFRSLRADGTRVLWNGQPFQMRGVLHWGYSPPSLAPPSDPKHWRPQLEYFASLGFNTVKCCLWIPPRGFYELCDELGLAVWQEYPTWHPTMDQAHKQELLREYREFFRLDKSHASVGFRSITCETGQGADLDVVRTLYDACKSSVPDTLVVDDSSWIGWQRVTDFWDEHPYGNNSWFPGRLQDFLKHIDEKGAKPLLLGECLAADTWVDRDAWLTTHGTQDLWWRPWCWDAQEQAEQWLAASFGSDLLRQLEPTARAFGLRNRQFQIEQLRLKIPDAGYVVSVARDFTKARMGLIDDLDRPKYDADAWRWHRDTMICLDLPCQARARTETDREVRVRVSHFAAEPLRGTLTLSCEELGVRTEVPLQVAAGGCSEVVTLALPAPRGGPRRVLVRAELAGSHPARNAWPLWNAPAASQPLRSEVLVTDTLTPERIDAMLAGQRVLLLCGDRKGTLRNDKLWFLKGAPFAPPHPIHQRLPTQLLLDTIAFDLESERVIPLAGLRDQVDPILAFWDTHDVRDVKFHLHAFDTRVGEGRLLATSMNLDGPRHSLPSWVRQQLVAHLADGPAPERALRDETIQALRAKLVERTIDLPIWRFCTDPQDQGRNARWFDPAHEVDGAGWRDLKAGSHWENQADDLRHYTGVAWYRIDVDVPADWQELDARAVFDGVDDSFHCWLNGELVGTFGDEASRTTIWLEQQVCELGRKLRPGQRNTLVLRVVDHAGAGGLWKPARLTTGPVGTAGDLLR
jgi:hypothetical protein